MQKLPYVVVTNSHISKVYKLYCEAFEAFRKFPEIKTVADNDAFCELLKNALRHHLSVIPSLAIGVLECRDMLEPEVIDAFMNTMLRSRISRRVIAEQHLALTETFNSPYHFPDSASSSSHPDIVGEVFLKCNGADVVRQCGELTKRLARSVYGETVPIPEIRVDGHLDTTFPYIPSHLEYMIGELLRNSMQATIETHRHRVSAGGEMPPIDVLICHAPQHIIFRVSDQGGGIPPEQLSTIWSFSKGSQSKTSSKISALSLAPTLSASPSELEFEIAGHTASGSDLTISSTCTPTSTRKGVGTDGSLTKFTSRPPNLRLGMGLPMSRVYAEYWAGKLELHSLEGFGTDAFLQLSKLGNKSEQITLDGL